MKIRYTKVMIAGAVLSLGACANHDLIPEIAEVGQAVPAVYWEVGSTSCKAGDAFSFQGKYTVSPGRTPLRSEVWYQILRSDEASASVKLAGASLSYTQKATSQDTMRSKQCHAVYMHDENYWNGHEYIVQGVVPTSRTLSPVSWIDAQTFDWTTFNTYYPEGFVGEFLNKIYDYLTGESADSYYNALRNVYLNYPFTNEQFAEVGLPQLDLSGDDQGTANKSDAWFATTTADDDAITGYYYITLDDAGNATYNEVAKDFQAPEGIVIYPVYKSAEWVFCRYDDNAGAIVSTVRPEWLPKFRTLISHISFPDWIYDSANGVYKVEFSRKYSLEAEYRAYDKETSRLNDATAPEYEGVTSKTEQKTIDIN